MRKRGEGFTGEQGVACEELPSHGWGEQYGGPTDTSDPGTTPDQYQYDGTLFTSGGSEDGPVPAMAGGGCPPEHPDARGEVCWR